MNSTAENISKEWVLGLKQLSPFLLQSPEPFVAVDNNLQCLFANEEATKLLSTIPDGILGKKIDDFGIIGSILDSSFKKVFSEKQSFVLEQALPISNDTRVYEAHYRLVVGEAQQTLGALVVLTDVTKRKNLELELEDSRRHFDAQSKALNVFDIIAETDRRGQITFVNDKFVEISKYSREELLGQDHRILNSGYHPKSFFREMWATISRGQVWTGEVRNRAKDGAIYWVSTVITPIFDAQGKIKNFLAVRREITKQKKMEEALKESELRFRELLNNVKLVVVGLDLRGRITFANKALLELLHKKLEDILGLDWFYHFVPENCRAEMIDVYSAALTQENFKSEYESEIITGAGDRRMIAWNNTIYRDIEGNIIGVTALGSDITQRKADEQKLAELNAKATEQREEIVGFVSHELRSPLTSIKIAAETLQDYLSGNKEESNEKPEESVKRIQQQVERIDRISKDLMEVSINRAGEFQYDPKPIHLNRLLEHICHRFREELKLKPNLSLKYNEPNEAIVGSWDASRLDQVFTNLLSNAMKYSRPEGGKIEVTLKTEGPHAHIVVSDTGLGIPKENLESIFGMFSRGDNVKKNRASGFGLGLKISRDIVQKHGGKIWAESELNKGTQIHVSLPLSGKATSAP